MRPSFRLVPDFIVPHLNKSTYGNHLQWEDKNNGTFKISRIHQSSEMWNEQCIEVYKAWSVKKKNWKLEDPKRITKAKHRLITALRRNPEIEILKKESTFYRFRLRHPIFSDDENTSNEWISGNSEMKKTAEISEINHVSEIENILKISRENIDYTLFNYSESATNSTHYLFPPELENPLKIFPMSDILCESLNLHELEQERENISDKCCCDILLDNYLCNQKCIWHGMPT